MSLIISLGTNIGDKLENLSLAKKGLENLLELEAQSRVYTSKAVDYTHQPDFYNQVLQFEIPELSSKSLIEKVLDLEIELGRVRKIDKGPRTIDIDILFWGTTTCDDPKITIPHPRLFERSFICYPLQELPYYEILKNHFHFSDNFDNEAFPL